MGCPLRLATVTPTELAQRILFPLLPSQITSFPQDYSVLRDAQLCFRPGYQKENKFLYPVKRKINLYQEQNISHKELRLPLQTTLEALRDVNLDAQISWRAQHFEQLQ